MMDPKTAMFNQGRADALGTQRKAPELTGTQIYALSETVPDFSAAVTHKNMLQRKAGFVCRSSAGRMVRLLQPYDSEVFPQEPEQLPAQWGFAWSQNPADALPFVQIASSPYNRGDVCSWDGGVYRSLIDGNVHSPEAYPQGWEAVK